MLLKIIDEVKKSVDNECFIAALALSLMIPDICGKAEYPGETTTTRYIKWYNSYIGNFEKPLEPHGADMPYPSGELIYNLRNTLFHQGTPNIDSTKIREERCKVDEFVLTISDVTDGGTSCVAYGKEYKISDRSLEINIINLFHKLCVVGKSYYWDNQEKFDFFRYTLEDQRYN